MTALIIGLIAAIGIGGGVAISNNSGGHGGGSSAAIVETNTGKADYTQKLALASTLEPNEEEFMSVLTDRDQYTNVSFGSHSSLTQSANPVASARAVKMLKAKSSANEVYVDIPEFNQLINDGTGENKRHLSLTNTSGVIRLTTGKLENDNSSTEEIYTVDFTNNMMSNESYARHFTAHSDVGDIKQQNDLYLGGAANNAHLTVADFGFWTEYRDRKTINDSSVGIITEYPIFLYDTRFLYAGGRRDTTTLNGNVLMIYENKATQGSQPYDVYGGAAELALDLAKGSATGNFTMGADVSSLGKGTGYFDYSFAGSLNGSQFSMGQITEAGVVTSNGAIGQLLVGKHGLEMVGIVDRRWADGNEAQYVFGARENN